MSLQKETQVFLTCSDLGGWLLEQLTCASRCLLLHTIKITAFHLFMQWFSVTMCYYGLSFASTSLSSGGPYLNYMLRWQSSENPTISKIKPDMEANNWSCFPQQCDDRDPWLPLLHLCHGLLGKETDPQLLSGCYQHSKKEVAIFSLAVFLLQIISGVACIFCGLLQGQTDPDLKNLQVSFC